MTQHRRAAILKLAANAHEFDLKVMQGVVQKQKSVGNSAETFTIGDHHLNEWLAAHQGQEVILVLGPVADERPLESRVCRKCGRDFSDLECPHCARQRRRIRGC